MNRKKNIAIISVILILVLGVLAFVAADITPAPNLNGFGRYSINNYTTINGNQFSTNYPSGLLTNASVRKEITTALTNVTVCTSGCNYTYIQAALNDVPKVLLHNYYITVKNSSRENESLFILPSSIGDVVSQTEGSAEGLILQGNVSNWNQVTINSIHSINSYGAQNPTIRYFNVVGRDPYSDENVSVAIYGEGHPVLLYLNLTNSQAKYGIMSYGASTTTSGIVFGNNLYSAYLIKHGGSIWNLNVADTGNTTSRIATIAGGYFFSRFDNITYGQIGDPFESPSTTGGFAYTSVGTTDENGWRKLFNINSFDQVLKDVTYSSMNTGKAFGIIRGSNTSEQTYFYVDDDGLVINSTQDENNGGSVRIVGGHNFSNNKIWQIENNVGQIFEKIMGDGYRYFNSTTNDFQNNSITNVRNITVTEKVCLNTACSSYIQNNGTATIIQ